MGFLMMVPVVFTHLVNFPDWTALDITLAGERFSLAEGTPLDYHRELNLRNGLLTRSLRWESPQGLITKLEFSRFASLADQHLMCQRVFITPENYSGKIQVVSRLDAGTDTMRYQQWRWLDQGVENGLIWLKLRTLATNIEAAMAQKVLFKGGIEAEIAIPDIVKMPSIIATCQAEVGRRVASKNSPHFIPRVL